MHWNPFEFLCSNNCSKLEEEQTLYIKMYSGNNEHKTQNNTVRSLFSNVLYENDNHELNQTNTNNIFITEEHRP